MRCAGYWRWRAVDAWGLPRGARRSAPEAHSNRNLSLLPYDALLPLSARMHSDKLAAVTR